MTRFKNKTLIVTEEVTAVNKENIIRQATSPGSITLLSKEFGRGTDFIIYDDRVNDAGGVHVIQTFLSEELSEETQIKGRAARQGCNGSYSMVLSELHLEKFHITLKDIDRMKSTNCFYDVLNKQRCIFFDDKYQSNIEYVSDIAKDHEIAINFLKNLFYIPLASDNGQTAIPTDVMDGVLEFLKDRNLSFHTEEETMSRTLVLMDATGSMATMITKTKNTVKRVFTETKAMLDQHGLSSSFEVQFAVYRNYNAPPDKILQYSGWENNPENLFQFMDTISASYGLGNEAIEVGLWHANNEFEKMSSTKDDKFYQVVLIGDMPPNTKEGILRGRTRYGWDNTYLSKDLFYESELQKLRFSEVPVHTFHVKEDAALSFGAISKHSGPGSVCSPLDIETSAGAEQLTGLLTERILNDVAGRGNKGKEMIDEYRKRFPKGYTKVSQASASVN